jgi:D-hexose-6-phosphate mutarotase
VEVEVTHLTSGAETAEAGSKFDAVTVKRSAAIRDAGPGLHAGSLHAPLDVVVWNAHKERCKTIADFGEQDYCHYVCVEPGRVYPPASTELAPGKQWTIKQEILLKSSSA